MWRSNTSHNFLETLSNTLLFLFCVLLIYILVFLFLPIKSMLTVHILGGGLLIALISGIVIYGIADQIKLNPFVLYLAFYIIYFLLGLLRLTNTYELKQTELWLLLFVEGLIGWIIGWKIGVHAYRRRQGVKIVRISSSLASVYVTMGISIISAILIFAMYGSVLFHQDNRAGVSTKLAYLTEFAIPAVLIYTVLSIQNHRHSIPWKKIFGMGVLFTFVMGVFGSRNQPTILMLGLILIVAMLFQNERSLSPVRHRLKGYLAVGVSLLIVGQIILYYIRFEFTSTVLGFENRIVESGLIWPEVTSVLLPFHASSRLNFWDSERILDNLSIVEAYCNPRLLIVRDFFTLLPGEQISAGRILHVGSGGGRTLGALGGLYISWGHLGVLLFYTVVGFLMRIAWFKYEQYRSPWGLTSSILGLIYLIQFSMRGLFKPMFLFVFVLLLIFWLESRVSAKDH